MMAYLRNRRSAPGTGPSDGAPAAAADGAATEEAGPAGGLAPSRMRGTEPLYGYVVGLELLVVAILNAVITTGKGAPAHPQTGLQVAGIAAAVLFFAVLQVRNRTVAGFSAIVAAFFVTLPKVPTVLSIPHILALAVPLAYGLIITQRQRRALGPAGRAGRRGRPDRAASDPGPRRGGRRAAPAPPPGPRPTGRYTPPKAKRGQTRR